MRWARAAVLALVLGCNSAPPATAQAEPARAVLCPELDMLESVTFETMVQYRVPTEPMAALRSAFAYARRTCPAAPAAPGGVR